MGIKIIAKNKRASFDYFLEDTFEAGLMLQGTEVKSLRSGHCTLGESFVQLDSKNEVWVYNMKIPPYQFGTYANHKEDRKRKLLLNAKEIEQLKKGLTQKGQTIVATKIYFKKSYVKLEIALAKGKKLHDKRESAAKKDIERKLKQGNYDF